MTRECRISQPLAQIKSNDWGGDAKDDNLKGNGGGRHNATQLTDKLDKGTVTSLFHRLR